MADKVFKNMVHVVNPETGDAKWFSDGDECPKEFEKYVDPKNFYGDDEEDEEAGDGPDYGRLTVPQLKDLLADRGIDASGNKADLVAALVASDEENAG